MTGFVRQLATMSLQAVLMIGVVFAARKLFELVHISKKYVMLLWAVPFFFLVFPWKLTVQGGFWNTAKVWRNGTQWEWIDEMLPVSGDNMRSAKKGLPDAHFEDGGGQETVPAGSEQEAGQFLNSSFIKEREAADAAQNLRWYPFVKVFAAVWAAGFLFFAARGIVSYWKLKRRVLCSVKNADADRVNVDNYVRDVNGMLKMHCFPPVYDTDGIQTPMVLGIFVPCIYLPAGMDRAYMDAVIAHEKTHIRRRDYLAKPAAYLIACLHWFNPAVWFAYFIMARDMEMACDEETILKFGMERRKEYASVLLELSTGSRKLFAVPPAFGEGDMKARIQNIMHYQKTAGKASIFAVAFAAVLTGVFLTADQQDAVRSKANVPDGAGQDFVQTAENKILTFQMVREAFAQRTVGQMEFDSYTNGTRDELHETAMNENLHFYFEEGNEAYRFSVSYKKGTDLLEDIYIMREQDAQMAWIYTADAEGGEQYPNDLEVFLHTKTQISDWLTLRLPEGYTLGDYRGDLDLGGALIYPQVYETGASESAPEYWKYAGFVGKVGSAQETFVFWDGKLDERYYPRWNHSSEEEAKVLDTAAPGAGWTVLMVHSFHDLYTGSELGALEMEGEELAALETQSEYWYFYFVKEGEEDAYVLSLAAKEFTREEAIRVVQTVRMTEKETR